MTRAAQRDSKFNVKEFILGACTCDEFFPQLFEWNRTVMGMKVYCLAIATMCAALSAGVIISLEYSGTPSYVWLGLSQYILLLGYASSPVSRLWTSPAFGTLYQFDEMFSGMGVVKGTVLGDSYIVHPEPNDDRSSATTLAEVLALVFLHPFIYATVIGAAMVSGIRNAFRPAFHNDTYYIEFNKDLQAKWGELLETLPGNAEGNQQPSREYTLGRFRDYWSSTVCLMTRLAPHAKAMI